MLRGFVEGDNFSVVEEVVLMPAFADYLTGAVEDDAADNGVGRGDGDAAVGEIKSSLHPVDVLVGLIAHGWSSMTTTIKFTWSRNAGLRCPKRGREQ